MVGCSFDPPKASRAFAEKFKFPFRLISDTSHQVGLLYGACDKVTDEYARRVAYLIDENGIIKEAHSKVNPAKFPFEQLARL